MSKISFKICRILDPKSQKSSNLCSKIAPASPGVSEKKSPGPRGLDASIPRPHPRGGGGAPGVANSMLANINSWYIMKILIQHYFDCNFLKTFSFSFSMCFFVDIFYLYFIRNCKNVITKPFI